jgi:DNA-binding CsgD family transcriptional regulator
MEPRLHLTPIERAVVRGLLRGESPTTTCARLEIKRSQYRQHIVDVMRKSGAKNQVELVNHFVKPL